MFTPRSSDLDLPQNITARHSGRAKRLALRLNRKNFGIDLVIPKRASKWQIETFVNSNEKWIKKTLSTLPSPVYFENDISFPFFGQQITLNIIKNIDRKRTVITLKDDVLQIETYLDDILPRLKRWIRQETQKRLEIMAFGKTDNLGKKLSNVTVRDTHTRWGSCGHKGTISFSWRLAFAPYEAIDYVVAHEVAHLKHMDHSKKFWITCESLCENYKAGKSWMRENGLELMRYCFDEKPQVRDLE